MNPLVAFEQEFLRWMLSDGAGAVLVEPEPRGRTGCRCGSNGSRSSPSPTSSSRACTGARARRRTARSSAGARPARSPRRCSAGLFNLTQDIKLLGKEISFRLVNGVFPKIRAKHGLAPGDVRWFLPHYSSEIFRQELHDRFVEIDFPIPFEAWFTNLAEKGNTGSASIFIILEELVRSNRIAPGDTILCFVPESARFSAAYALLTRRVRGPGRLRAGAAR